MVALLAMLNKVTYEEKNLEKSSRRLAYLANSFTAWLYIKQEMEEIGPVIYHIKKIFVSVMFS